MSTKKKQIWIIQSIFPLFIILINRNSALWNVKYEDCYAQCGLKGGSCSYCNDGYSEGYCCRKDGVGGNGDCPTTAIQSIPNGRNYHLCVSRHKSEH